jgi:hypothetical protein
MISPSSDADMDDTGREGIVAASGASRGVVRFGRNENRLDEPIPPVLRFGLMGLPTPRGKWFSYQ